MGKHEECEVMPLITIPVIYDALGTHMIATTCAIWILTIDEPRLEPMHDNVGL